MFVGTENVFFLKVHKKPFTVVAFGERDWENGVPAVREVSYYIAYLFGNHNIFHQTCITFSIKNSYKKENHMTIVK